MVFSFFQIKGQSMEPLLKEGDFVCASGLPYFFCSPREEELVVCAHPVDRKMLVKRIVSRKNSRYWVEGVNANESTDSREFGWLEKKQIKGKVLFVVNAQERGSGE
ncbi:MAG: hypothetical protein A3E07_03415 [Candidatus Wildermuthbacteria bacterium RIFCSPHIGHO2_12_FULL_45_9]|uniref:Peptidase S26 domain-containing protein n=1 Tax=Candidatus Wildermuthbacteria bacterium RIFCSPHIGHO2_02_FULL_45_25 TaxID=1802450 RepID=A0A1G2R0K0_9BACT|nr:MAG: hypothetical protein A2748_03585 [Candidatus Wildermuthbacteria bacterium RIFCSPHIGHO2_01_FULL_45_20]OHA66118.1 MAG: hypothetical protein A3C04_03720 [Candidatus Wildermuthbacteria bacterium RIFCSPHIGHO2_02_FULL_45_25]OHA71394.1 MAG: hypothetical protein A3E07_03415 [Candidatus Wildermuthbacteria bacterium RIFCSPHIGHO2_12_FULL_45_9]